MIVLVIVAAVGVIAGIHLLANRSFDAALAEQRSATARLGDEIAVLATATDDAVRTVEASRAVIDHAADDMVDPAARTVLAEATATLGAAVARAEAHLAEEIPGLPAKPMWTWELLAAMPRIEATTTGLSALAADMRTAEEGVDQADRDVVDAAATVYASVPAAAAQLEAANVSAVNFVVLDFREDAESAADQTLVGSHAAVAFRDYAYSVAALKTSAQNELAEKAGPLMATRLEIEAFARSISGGVRLDFDWAPTVLGIGGSRGMAGTATWVPMRGGFSTITLSDSVAENWPSADARALVAHEVGHSITAKCSHMFDSANDAANEQWATAWAISMGHVAEGNGTQAYGYPPAELIATAAACR